MKFFKLLQLILALLILTILAGCQPAVVAKETKPFPAKTPSSVQGKKIYEKYCLKCHGKFGKGDGSAARDLSEKPADFSDADFMRREEPVEFFEKVTKGKKPMPSFKQKLNPDERWNSVFYIWTFTTTGEKIEEGKKIYEANCAACHGKKGDGKGPKAKDLKEKPTDFTDARHMMAESSKDLFKVATEGEKPMPSFKDKLSEDERWSVTDYIWTFSYETD